MEITDEQRKRAFDNVMKYYGHRGIRRGFPMTAEMERFYYGIVDAVVDAFDTEPNNKTEKGGGRGYERL